MASDRVPWTGWAVLVHSLRTAVAAVASVLVARLFRLPETYWAAITTLVITQSSLGAALAVSWQRFVGTALGAAVWGVFGRYLRPPWVGVSRDVFFFGVVFALGPSGHLAFLFLGWSPAGLLVVTP